MSDPADITDFRGNRASKIDDGHWQSGLPLPFSQLVRCGVDLVVLSAGEMAPSDDDVAHVRKTCPGLGMIIAPLDDTEDLLALPRIVQVARGVARRVAQRLSEGKTVLVTCQAGRNRSGLISALALIERRGISGLEAARIVRAARSADLPPGEEALSNRAFREYVEGVRGGDPRR